MYLSDVMVFIMFRFVNDPFYLLDACAHSRFILLNL